MSYLCYQPAKQPPTGHRQSFITRAMLCWPSQACPVPPTTSPGTAFLSLSVAKQKQTTFDDIPNLVKAGNGFSTH